MYKMIVIDDEYLVRLGIQETINWQDYEIEIVGTAKNGKEGLKLYNELKPDIILTDVKMPIMDGVELLKELNKDDVDAIIIMLSGYKDFEYAKNSLENGAYCYLLKPIDNNDLIKSVIAGKEELIKRRINKQKINDFNKEIPLIRSTLIQKLLANNENDIESIKKENINYNYNIPNDGFIVIAQIDKSNNIENKNFIKESLKTLYSVATLELSSKGIEYVDIMLFSHFILLIKETNIDNIYNTFIEVLNKYKEEYATITISISEHYDDISQIYDKYADVKKLFKNKMSSLVNSIITCNSSYTQYREEVSKTLNYIALNYQDNISVKVISETLGISESHLMHILKDELGKTFNEVLTEYRIKIAKTLLQSPKYRVYEIGPLVGYNDLKYFRKIFMKVVGCSPNDYRKRISQ